MSHFESSNGDKFNIFGKGGGDALADQFAIPLLGKIPISEGTNDVADDGTPLINQDKDTPTKSAIEKLITVIAEKLPPIVDETCTGRLAKVFEELGGKVIYYGKPHKEIYSKCFDKNEKVLAIGDNLRTDIKGANNLNIDSIFISNGVHRNEFENQNELQELFKK